MILADLTRRGFQVSVPYGDNARYDLLVDDGHGLHRVQVKYLKPVRGGIPVKFRSSCGGHYTWDEVDRMAIYEPIGNDCYYLDKDDMAGRTAMVLRLQPTGNNQAQGIVWAEQYKEW